MADLGIAWDVLEAHGQAGRCEAFGLSAWEFDSEIVFIRRQPLQ
jgi:hypothetical protein